MPLPSIPATAPVTTPAVPAITYPTWHMTMLHIDAQDVAHNKYTVTANLSRSADNGDGTVTIDPISDQVVITLSDLYAAAAADTSGTLAQAMGAVILALINIGTAQGKL